MLDLSGFGGGDDPVTTAIGLIFMVIGLVVALPIILVFLGLVFEIALLLALVPLVVAVRVALGRPWTVQVIGPDHVVRHTEKVVGWQASGERIAQLGDQIRNARQGTGTSPA